MFTAHLTVLALLTFLAGANAGCSPCAATWTRIDGMTYKLAYSSVEVGDSYVECGYSNKLGNDVNCQYSVRAFWMFAAQRSRLTYWRTSEFRRVGSR
ncbi:hypothetical protein BDR07DRAFT_1606859 [Suillus spraguei]|nr:hypothetical protein BDR07DRAFT_1606859 [Suillus spraguei]